MHKHPFIKACLTMSITASSALSTAANIVSLEHHPELWNNGTLNSKSANTTLFSAHRAVVGHEVNASNDGLVFHLKKSITGYEHYSVEYQGYPVINSNFVLIRDHSGMVKQGLGQVVLNIANDIPDAESAFKKSLHEAEEKAQSILNLNHPAEINETQKAFYLKDGKAFAVYKITLSHIDEKSRHAKQPIFLIDAKTLDVVEQWEGLHQFEDEQYIKGGGISGNNKQGVICFSPQADSMQNCTKYVWDHPDRFPDDPGIDYATRGGELLYEANVDQHVYFSEFDGYPYIVKKSGDECILENDYVKTVEYVRNDEVASDTAYKYSCDESGELFREDKNSEYFWLSFSLEPLSALHFYGGLTMQMYSQYLADVFPQGGYQLNQLKQRANFPAMNAYWDYGSSGYTDYGSGSGINFYQFTTLDVISHESTHAFSAWNVNQAESGLDRSFNEGLSDLAAIAAKDYLSKGASGGYTKMSIYDQWLNTKKWWLTWDLLVEDSGSRYFARPSDDWLSINDAREFTDSLQVYPNNGPYRKFFYELINTYNWSIEEAFKLNIGAATRCFYPNMGYQGAATCLLNEVNQQFDVLLATDRFNQVDVALHSVGMVPTTSASEIEPLKFEFNQFYEQAVVTIDESYRLADISEIKVVWDTDKPTDNTEIWYPSQSDVQIPQFKKLFEFQKRDYLAKVQLTKSDHTVLTGYRYIYLDDSHTKCKPANLSTNGEIETLSILGQQMDLDFSNPSFYDFVGYSDQKLNSSQTNHFNLTGSFSNKYLLIALDKNRDGIFKNDEIVVNQSLSGSSVDVNLPDLNSVTPGPVVMRIAVSNRDTMPACYENGSGMMIDVHAETELSLPPPVVDFSYKVLSGTRVQFTADVSGIDESRNPKYLWEHESEVIGTQESFTHDFNSTGKFPVKLTVTYATDNLSSFQQKQVDLTSAYCEPPNSNALDPLHINALYSNYEGQIPGLNSTGSIQAANGFIYHQSQQGDVYMVMPENRSITLIVDAFSSRVSKMDRLRATLWVDLNQNGVFEVNESNTGGGYGSSSSFQRYNSTCYKNCEVYANVSYKLPPSPGLQPYRARLRIERFEWDRDRDDTSAGSNACSAMHYGETEDFDLFVDP